MALFGTPFKEKELVARVVRRFRQELMGENCENLDRIVSEHREALARILWKENCQVQLRITKLNFSFAGQKAL